MRNQTFMLDVSRQQLLKLLKGDFALFWALKFSSVAECVNCPWRISYENTNSVKPIYNIFHLTLLEFVMWQVLFLLSQVQVCEDRVHESLNGEAYCIIC